MAVPNIGQDTVKATKLSNNLIDKWRQRSPSVSTMLGITKIKKQIRKTTGLNAIARWTPTRVAQRVKQKVGLYNPILRKVRAIRRGNVFNVAKMVPNLGE